MQIVLETERMLLRRFTEADAGLLAALYGDPRVMQFITLQPPSLAEVESFTSTGTQEFASRGSGMGGWPGRPDSLAAGHLSEVPRLCSVWTDR